MSSKRYTTEMAKARENMTKSIDSQERAPRIRAS
jgi:hypothetical protein